MSLAQTFARSAFSRFMNSPGGRFTRVIIGLGVIVWIAMDGSKSESVVFIVVGLLLIIGGLFDLCLISLLLGGPISGKKIRSEISKP